MTILIVEDEPKVLELLSMFFTGRGHRVLTNESGEGALPLLDQKPDVLVLDMWLKGRLNGMDVMKEARRRLPSISIVVITGLEDVPQDELVAHGVTALMRKPIRLEELDLLLKQVDAARKGTPA